MTVHEQHGTSFQATLTDTSGSPMKRYQELVIGGGGWGALAVPSAS